MTPLPDDDELQQEAKDDPKSPSANSPSPAKKPAMITVESSIETLTDLLENMEEDELPVQSQSTEQALEQEAQTKPSYYKHRFSNYRKSFSTTYPAATLSQLTLFKTFCKCLKSIDNQIQILPLRNDITKKTLSGDFYIGTKYTFKELIANSNLLTWFMQNGYNITLNGCQSSDMVRIGLLMRVRGFTYRDDLRNYILESNQWKNNQFHFRLYFDSFSSNSKGSFTYVLMLDVDRPSIETGMKFFQEFFDGDAKNSPK
jgi:hypothetical protein